MWWLPDAFEFAFVIARGTNLDLRWLIYRIVVSFRDGRKRKQDTGRFQPCRLETMQWNIIRYATSQEWHNGMKLQSTQ
jgi:hypothetical protein